MPVGADREKSPAFLPNGALRLLSAVRSPSASACAHQRVLLLCPPAPINAIGVARSTPVRPPGSCTSIPHPTPHTPPFLLVLAANSPGRSAPEQNRAGDSVPGETPACHERSHPLRGCRFCCARPSFFFFLCVCARSYLLHLLHVLHLLRFPSPGRGVCVRFAPQGT